MELLGNTTCGASFEADPVSATRGEWVNRRACVFVVMLCKERHSALSFHTYMYLPTPLFLAPSFLLSLHATVQLPSPSSPSSVAKAAAFPSGRTGKNKHI